MIYTEHELAKKLQDVSVSSYKPNWNKKEIPKKIVSDIPKEDVTKKEEIQEELEEISFDNF